MDLHPIILVSGDQSLIHPIKAGERTVFKIIF